MSKRCAALLICTALPLAATADTREVVAEVVVPAYQKFANSAADLAATAARTCDVQTLRPDFQEAYDDWMAIGFLHLGPSEEGGRALAILFWPDAKSLGAKAQRALLAGEAAALDEATFAKQSVAARGLPALERLLYPEAGLLDLAGADPCPLLRATARNLALNADALQQDWEAENGFAALLLTAGAEGNSRYLTETEARQALFTQMMSGLEFIADQRLGRPLGGEDRPRPERAEAKASGRSQRNVLLGLEGLRRFGEALDPSSAKTLAAFDQAIFLAKALEDPIFAGVSEPQTWAKVEELRQSVKAIRETALSEMAVHLGVDLGFNAQDGD